MTRDVIIIDRTFCELGFKENAYRIMVSSFDTFDGIFADGSNILLRKFFHDPSYEHKTAIIMLTVAKGLTLKRRQLFLDPLRKHRWRQRMNALYASIGLKNPHSATLTEIKVISESEFLKKMERAHGIAEAVFEKLRKKPSIEEFT